MASGLWTDQRYILTRCHHHQCRLSLSSEGENHQEVSKPSEPLQDAWVAMRSDLVSELKPTPTPAVSGLRSLDRRSEVLNDLQEEVERNVRRKRGSWEGELAVPHESKDAPIQPDSGSGKRRAMKAVTAAASSSGLQMGGRRTVTETLTQQDSM